MKVIALDKNGNKLDLIVQPTQEMQEIIDELWNAILSRQKE